MGLRRPTADDLLEAAALNNLDPTDEEIEAYLSMVPELFEAFDTVDQMPIEEPIVSGAVRDPGIRPATEEDPLNAIVRRCRVKGPSSGKLDGVRVGLKDSVSVAGVPMTLGSRVISGYVSDVDATVTRRLLDEGAEIVAMLNMDDFAWSGSGGTSAYGPTFNPHSSEHLAGGSSAGSGAALYYDDIDMTLGGDQGGSIRIPASWCGVVGLKPTFGLVPYTGIVGGGLTIDHIGPMARTTQQVALMLDVIAGEDGMDPRQNGVRTQDYSGALDGDVKGFKIGVVKEGFGLEVSEAAVDSSVRSALDRFAGLGAEVEEVSVPAHSTAMSIYSAAMTEDSAALFRAQGFGYGWSGYYQTGLRETLGRAFKAQANDLPRVLQWTMLVGTYLSEHYSGRLHAKGQNLRPVLRAGYDAALERYDALAMPTVPMRAVRHDPADDWKALMDCIAGQSDNCGPFNITGHPGLSIPCGKPDGLPVGLMLIGRHFDDATLLKAGHAFEQNVDWETL